MVRLQHEELEQLIQGVRAGTVTPDHAVAVLRRLPFAEVGDALVDHHRALRQGMPEAVLGSGKTAEQCVRIVGELLHNGSGPVLVTRASPGTVEALTSTYPDSTAAAGCVLWRAPETLRAGNVLVVSAGTADRPAVDEVAITLQAFGERPDVLVDVGVAGLHRLLAHVDRITGARVVVVVAGMEGALASVVGGLTDAPVIAVPTSVGYGAGLEGVTALLAMHASCAAGISVVGIDNGYGAACAAVRALGVRR
jgi:hypothetical protein